MLTTLRRDRRTRRQANFNLESLDDRLVLSVASGGAVAEAAGAKAAILEHRHEVRAARHEAKLDRMEARHAAKLARMDAHVMAPTSMSPVMISGSTSASAHTSAASASASAAAMTSAPALGGGHVRGVHLRNNRRYHRRRASERSP